MKFDVIISNPPYNKDMYLDFVNAAYDLLTNDGMGVFITPAKFYAKDYKKNEDFRAKLMPHIEKVLLWKCCTDIFDIAEHSGIAAYTVHKTNTFDNKPITNYNKNASLATNEEVHNENPIEFMPLKCLSLINKVKQVAGWQALFANIYIPSRYAYYCKNTTAGHDKQFEDDMPLMSGVGNKLAAQGYISKTELRTTEHIEKYKAIINEMMSGKGLQLDKNNQTAGPPTTAYIEPYQINKGSYVNLYFANTQLEIESFLSYFNSQLVAFIATNATTNKTTSNATWRHVPALPAGYKFDHIYTNEEIFKIFELTDEEVKLITNLIKPRKEK